MVRFFCRWWYARSAKKPLGTSQVCPECFDALMDSLATTWMGIALLQGDEVIPVSWKEGLIAISKNLRKWSFEKVVLMLWLEVERVKDFLNQSTKVPIAPRQQLMTHINWLHGVVKMWGTGQIATA